jgi:N-acetyl-1-D-myo-inositol-2-amino-2-deoxy-alpha-D-glucopyranoside deacetylase
MDRRILFVHAHPDDECIGTGGTMARYAADGAHVTLVTCTLGEEGEVVVPELAHLASDRDDALGRHRHTELATAMSRLGVSDWRLLGGPGRFRDSGMVGTAPNERPDSFWRTDLLVAASELVAVIREVRPQVVVTYDENGGYGHPDHIQAHRVTHYAIDLARVAGFRPDLGEAWTVAKVYWTAMPRSVVRAGIVAMAEAGLEDGFAALDPDDLPFACDDDLVTTAVDVSGFLTTKLDALREHRTQVTVDGGFFALADSVGVEAFGTEYYRRAGGAWTKGGATDLVAEAREPDLFDGLAE